MRLFSCQACAQMLYFENTRCERCRRRLGYLPEADCLSALEPDETSPQGETLHGQTLHGQTWRALGSGGRRVRLCANAAHDVCNWLVDAACDDDLCSACRHNKIIPGLAIADNRLAWRKIEAAKHQLFYSLFRLGLTEAVDLDADPEPLIFKFLADFSDDPRSKVMTGHEDGVVTIALSEADDAEREQRRKMMGEPYRTLLGHFRHEVGHFFWDKLVRDGGRLAACRAVFGNDEEDYEAALKRHYESGPPQDWQETFVSAYATTHPWEDFAETWAHYLHIVDTLEMSHAYDLRLAPVIDKGREFAVDYALDPYAAPDIQSIIDVWLPVSTALNSLNRCMGKEELYPFVLSPPVIRKLGFMHALIRDAASPAEATRLAS